MASNKPPKNRNKRWKKSRRDFAKPNEKGYANYNPDTSLPFQRTGKPLVAPNDHSKCHYCGKEDCE